MSTNENRETPAVTPPIKLGFLACLLGIPLLALYWPVVFGGQTFFYRDFGVLAYPGMAWHREMFWSGQFPFWNPYSNLGAPFMAQWGTMTLYPGSLFYLILPMPWSVNVFCLLHLLLGGIGMFRLCRFWIGDDRAAAVGALVFLFNGLTAACMAWPNYLVALGWMPWVVEFVVRGVREDRRPLIIAALVGSMQMMSGVPEVILITWLFAGLAVLAVLVKEREQVVTTIARFVGLVILIAGVCAVQLLPFFELLSLSQRGSEDLATKWALPVRGLGNLVFPMFHTFFAPQGTVFQPEQHFLVSTYLGLIPLLLVVGGLFSRIPKMLLGMAFIGVVMVLLALGPEGFLYPMVKALLPGFGFVRYPVKFLLALLLVLPVLAAWGVRSLIVDPKEERPTKLLITAGLLALLFAGLVWHVKSAPFDFERVPVALSNAADRAVLFGLGLVLLLWWRSERASSRNALAAVAGLAVILAIDGARHLPLLNPTIDSSVLTQSYWDLQKNGPPPAHGTGRIMLTPAADETMNRSTITNFTTDMVGKRLAQWSHLNLLDRIPKVNGSSTLRLGAQAELEELIYKQGGITNEALLNLMNVQFVSDPLTPAGFVARTNRGAFLKLDLAPQSLFENRAINLFGTKSFDPDYFVMVRSQVPAGRAPVIPPAQSTIISQRIEPNLFSFEYESGTRAYARISQTWYPTWEALIDGSPHAVIRVDHAFQGIELPQGRHRVEVRFRDPMFRNGLICSVIFLAFLFCRWLTFKRLEHRHPPA